MPLAGRPGLPNQEQLSLMRFNVFFWVCFSAAPDGPPVDVTLQPMTSQSIQVTWKVCGLSWARGLGLQYKNQEEFPGQNINLCSSHRVPINQVL